MPRFLKETMTSKLDQNKGAVFGSTELELKQFFIGLGQVTFDTASITFKNYPFENSVISTNSTITTQDIINICIR